MKHPMIATPVTHVNVDKNEKCEKIKEDCFRIGIPDPSEELLVQKEEFDKGCNLSVDFIDVTHSLCQGIPDPWKKRLQMELQADSKKKGQNRMKCIRFILGHGFLQAENVCCPHCDERIIILSSKKDCEVKNADNPPEKSPQLIVDMKDACVETEEISISKEENIEESEKEAHKCKYERKHESCKYTACNPMRKESICSCKKQNQFSCCDCSHHHEHPRNCHNQTGHCLHSLSAVFPHAFSSLHNKYNSGRLLNKGQPYPLGNEPSVLPFIYNDSKCSCHPQQLIGFQEKGQHYLEMKLVCPKCERSKKRRTRKEKRNGKQGNDRREYPLCHCDEKKYQTFLQEQLPSFCKTEKAEGASQFHCNLCKAVQILNNKIPLLKYPGIDETEFMHCNEKRYRKHVQAQRDYTKLLQILGLNHDYQKPKLAPKMHLTTATSPHLSVTNQTPWGFNTSRLKTDFNPRLEKTDKVNNNQTYNLEEEWMGHICERHDEIVGHESRQKDAKSRSSWDSLHPRRDDSHYPISVQTKNQSKSKLRKGSINEEIEYHMQKLKYSSSSDSAINIESKTNYDSEATKIVDNCKRFGDLEGNNTSARISEVIQQKELENQEEKNLNE